VASEGFEPTKSMTADLQSDPFGRLGNLPVQRTCVEANALREKFIGKSPSDKPWNFGAICRGRSGGQQDLFNTWGTGVGWLVDRCGAVRGQISPKVGISVVGFRSREIVRECREIDLAAGRNS
jgi:hypothetical protein